MLGVRISAESGGTPKGWRNVSIEYDLLPESDADKGGRPP